MNSVWYIDPLHLTLRLLLALIMGGIIGYERERSNHPAGFRTHILVGIGSTLIMLISIYGFAQFANEPNVRLDLGRIAAQVVSGIGFLGAGTILRYGFTVIGLTTAASLWVVSGIGLALGAGMYFAAGLTTILTWISLRLFSSLEKTWYQKENIKKLTVKTLDRPGVLGEVATKFGENKINVKKVAIEETEEKDLIVISFHLQFPRNYTVMQILEQLKRIKGIKEVNIE